MITFFTWVAHILSAIGAMSGILFIIIGNEPCTGDGCIIHVMYIIGAVLFLFSAFIFLATREALKRQRKKQK